MNRAALTLLAKYFVVGGICALVDWGVFAWGSFGLGLHYLLAATLSFVLATLLNYVLCVLFVFEAGARFNRKAEIVALFGVSTIGMVVNHAVLFAAANLFDAHLMLAKVVATGVVFFWNFFLRKYFVFKAPDDHHVDQALH